MNGFAFEAEMQPDGSYIMSASGVTYRCKDWKDVVETYKKHSEGKSNGKEAQYAEVQRDV